MNILQCSHLLPSYWPSMLATGAPTYYPTTVPTTLLLVINASYWCSHLLPYYLLPSHWSSMLCSYILVFLNFCWLLTYTWPFLSAIPLSITKEYMQMCMHHTHYRPTGSIEQCCQVMFHDRDTYVNMVCFGLTGWYLSS